MKRPLGYKGRSIWKGNLISFIRNNTVVSRTCTISKFDVLKNVYVSNGQYVNVLMIERKYVGYKIGQFSFTKKMGMGIHIGKKKKKRLKLK